MFTNKTSLLGEQLKGIFTSKTLKTRTCWCTKAILWELNMEIKSFAPKNFFFLGGGEVGGKLVSPD